MVDINNSICKYNKNLIDEIKKFKYPVGECKGIRYWKCDKGNKRELIGYSYFNIQIIDNGTVYPSGEKEKVPTCLDCFLYEKVLMEKRMAEKKYEDESIIPYKWFYFYNYEDEKKYPDNWERHYKQFKEKGSAVVKEVESFIDNELSKYYGRQ